MLNVGCFTSPAGVWRRGDDLDLQVRYPVPAYLIETGEERILVDTGLRPGPPRIAASHYGAAEALALFRLEQEASVAEQVDLDTIDRVVITTCTSTTRRPRPAAGVGSGRAPAPRVGGRPRRRRDREELLVPADYAGLEDRALGRWRPRPARRRMFRLLRREPRAGPPVRRGRRAARDRRGRRHYASVLDDHRFPAFADDFEAQAESAERLRALRDAGAVVSPGHDPAVLVAGFPPVRLG